MRCTSIALLLLAACSMGEATQQGAVRDSVGIRIIQNPEVAPDTSRWSIAPTPRLVIGDEAKGARYSFGAISSIVRLRDGRLAVADGRALEIRMYDSTGSFVRSMGRRGQGPGEFRSLSSLFLLPGDTIVVTGVYEGEAMSYFAPTGEYVRRTTLPSFIASASNRSYRPAATVGFFADGSVLGKSMLMTFRGVAVAGRGPVVRADSARFIRLASPHPSTGRLVPADSSRLLADHGDWVVGWAVRYPAPTPGDPRGDGFEFTDDAAYAHPSWATRGTDLYASTGDSFEFRVYREDGRLRRIVRKEHMPRPVPPTRRDSVWAPLATHPQLAWLRLSEAGPPPLPLHSPATDRILMDPLGNLWVRSSPLAGGEAPSWFVFDTTGALRHSLKSSLDIRQIDSDRVVAVLRDSLDVQRVGVFDIRKRR
jgi:hypothetical protein